MPTHQQAPTTFQSPLFGSSTITTMEFSPFHENVRRPWTQSSLLVPNSPGFPVLCSYFWLVVLTAIWYCSTRSIRLPSWNGKPIGSRARRKHNTHSLKQNKQNNVVWRTSVAGLSGLPLCARSQAKVYLVLSACCGLQRGPRCFSYWKSWSKVTARLSPCLTICRYVPCPRWKWLGTRSLFTTSWLSTLILPVQIWDLLRDGEDPIVVESVSISGAPVTNFSVSRMTRLARQPFVAIVDANGSAAVHALSAKFVLTPPQEVVSEVELACLEWLNRGVLTILWGQLLLMDEVVWEYDTTWKTKSFCRQCLIDLSTASPSPIAGLLSVSALSVV